MEHYFCYRVYVTNTRAKSNSANVEFSLQHTQNPIIAAIDAATTAYPITKTIHHWKRSEIGNLQRCASWHKFSDTRHL